MSSYSFLSSGVLKQKRRGYQVIVIHPGSRYIRIGRASDVNPIQVPCVVARKCRTPIEVQERVKLVSRPRTKDAGSSLAMNETLEIDPVSLPALLLSRRAVYSLSLMQSCRLSPLHFVIV